MIWIKQYSLYTLNTFEIRNDLKYLSEFESIMYNSVNHSNQLFFWDYLLT